MSIKYRRSYRFAVKSSLVTTLFGILLLIGLQYLFFQINLVFTILFALIFFAFSFFLLQYRVERFIYRRIQKIYKEVSILDESVLRNQPVTTDMQTLMAEIGRASCRERA